MNRHTQTTGLKEPVDVLIVGAGPAGLAAALVLGRMRRHVLVLDADDPAHAVSEGVHGFLSQDGTPPQELRRIAREQLEPYTSVELRQATVRSARRLQDGTFHLRLTGGGESVTGRRLLLAHGMEYGLPDIDGLADVWATKVFHCPYCHGWEVRDQAVAVYGCGERAVHQALLLGSLSNDITLLCPDSAHAEDREARLAAAGVTVRSVQPERIEERGGRLHIALRGGGVLERDALFVQPALSLRSDIAISLGAELTEAGTIAVDPTGCTSVDSFYAAGDAAAAVQSVAVASGSGARAAYALNAGLAPQPLHLA